MNRATLSHENTKHSPRLPLEYRLAHLIVTFLLIVVVAPLAPFFAPAILPLSFAIWVLMKRLYASEVIRIGNLLSDSDRLQKIGPLLELMDVSTDFEVIKATIRTLTRSLDL